MTTSGPNVSEIFNQNTYIFYQETAFENVIKMFAIFLLNKKSINNDLFGPFDDGFPKPLLHKFGYYMAWVIDENDQYLW